MISNTLNDSLEGTDISKLGININNLTFNLMVDGIYQNKLGSVIREIATNARDSIIEAQKGKLVITVTETENSIILSFKDTGLGLSKEETETYLCNLNSSSKRSSNNTVGYMGIGSKSPFSLTPSYNYICIKDNVKTTLELFRIGEESPRYTIFSSDTTEEDSVECLLNIAKTDIDRNTSKCTQLVLLNIVKELALFDIPIELYLVDTPLKGGIDYYPIIFPKVFDRDNVYLLGYDDDYPSTSITNLRKDIITSITNEKQVASGVVAYGYSYVKNSRPYRYGNSDNSNTAFIFKTNIADVTFTSSREYIEDTEENKAVILRAISGFLTANKALFDDYNVVECLINSRSYHYTEFRLHYRHLFDEEYDLKTESVVRNTCTFLYNLIRDKESLLLCYILSQIAILDLTKDIPEFPNAYAKHMPFIQEIIKFYSSVFERPFSVKISGYMAGGTAVMTKLYDTVVKLYNYSSYSKNPVDNKSDAGKDDNKVFILTNERFIQTFSAKDTVTVIYAKKESRSDRAFLSNILEVTDLFIKLGYSVKTFFKLKDLLEDEECSYLYASLKQNTTSVTRPTTSVGGMELNTEGLVLREKYTFNAHKGAQLVSVEGTSTKIVREISKDLPSWGSSVYYIPKTIVGTTEEIKEFMFYYHDLGYYTSTYYVFEADNEDIPEIAMTGIFKNLHSSYTTIEAPLNPTMSDSLKATYAFKRLDLKVSKMAKQLEMSLLELEDDSWSVKHLARAVIPLNIQTSEKFESKIDQALYGTNRTKFRGLFYFSDFFITKYLGQEFLNEVNEIVNKLTPVIDQDAYKITFKEAIK